MNISVDTLLVVSLMMAVFAAVTTLGTSLILGVGFERLRNGVEVLKKQSGFFSDSLGQLDQRTEALEKQGSYFFQTIQSLETKMAEPPKAVAPPEKKEEVIAAPAAEDAPILVSANEAAGAQADSLLSSPGFTSEGNGTWSKPKKNETIYNFH